MCQRRHWFQEYLMLLHQPDTDGGDGFSALNFANFMRKYLTRYLCRLYFLHNVEASLKEGLSVTVLLILSAMLEIDDKLVLS